MAGPFLRDPANDAVVGRSVTASVLATTTTGTTVDMLTGDGRCTMFVDIVATSLTSASVRVQQSTLTDSGFADISGASVTTTTHTGAFTPAFDRDHRYLKAIVVINGTTANVSATVFERKKTF